MNIPQEAEEKEELDPAKRVFALGKGIGVPLKSFSGSTYRRLKNGQLLCLDTKPLSKKVRSKIKREKRRKENGTVSGS